MDSSEKIKADAAFWRAVKNVCDTASNSCDVVLAKHTISGNVLVCMIWPDQVTVIPPSDPHGAQSTSRLRFDSGYEIIHDKEALRDMVSDDS